MATSILCNNNKPARDELDARRRTDELSFGFAGGGGGGSGGCHTTTITLDGSGRNAQSQLVVKPQSGMENNYLKQQQQQQSHQPDRPTLVDLLIDSQCDWRQLISEANGPQEKLSQHLSETQIKRQEIIHELIQTERHHCLTLALMRQVYLAGLLRLNELRQRNSNSNNSSISSSSTSGGPGAGNHHSSAGADTNTQQRLQGEPIDIERLFPALEELIQAHELFFAHLRLRLVECCGQSQRSGQRQDQPLVGIIGPLGDLLIEQFKLSHESAASSAKRHKLKCHAQSMNKTSKTQQQSQATAGSANARTDTNGYKLLQAYAKFCGQHYESSRYYKQLLQFDKGFKQFIEQCNKQHAACRQRGIPECNLLVAQRLTKYPLLIEQLIKASKDEPNDEEEKLRRALSECRALLAELNSQLARKESFERLLDIYAQFSPKSHTIFYHKSALRFTKHDLLQHKRLRQLLHSDDQEQQISSSQQVAAVSRFAHLDQQLGASIAPGREDANDGHEMATAAAYHQQAANTTTNNPLTTTTNNYLHQPPAPSSAVPSVRYYFANIDNKSSVISLSKLLVREKAVEEAEPRVYLISSSPKRPEMYELAFISRRHQTTFIGKLKTAIEAHNKSKLGLSLDRIAATSLRRSSTTLTETGGCGYEPTGPAASRCSGSSECCSLASCSSGSSSSSSSISDGWADGPGSELPSDVEDEVGDCEDHARENTTQTLVAGREPTTTTTTTTTTMTTITTSQQVSTTTASSRNHQADVDLENLELDIEQELVPAPSCLDLTVACELADEETKDVAGVLRVAGATPPSTHIGETGLSERARDSCDDLSSPRLWLGQGCRRQKARGNRKRRFQRPRQVSNQSTDSGTTSGTSLTSGLGSGDCLEFGAAGSHAGSVQSSPSVDSMKQVVAVAANDGETCRAENSLGKDREEQEEEGEGEEDLDSGRGRDDCSSSSSSSTCHDSMTTGGSSGGGGTKCAGQQRVESGEQSRESASCGPTSPQPHLATTTTTTSATGVALLASGQQALAGHKQHPLKQRKLSTVSTISSQMKLLQKLRSVGLLATAATVSGGPTTTTTTSSDQLSGSGSANHRQQPGAAPLSLCASCMYHQQQQQQHEALDDTLRGASSTSKRHLRQLSKRRSLFVPEQKLEELRNLRIQLDKDKQEWQEKFDRMQEQLLNERRDLDLARERLKLDRSQIENEREQLYRKLEILKENGILLSPSHKVIITSPDQCARLMLGASGGQVNQQQQPVSHNQHHFQHQTSLRIQQQQPPPVYINHQQQQQHSGYGAHQTVLMQQQPAHTVTSARVPVHLSQQTGGAQQQQPQQHYASIRPSGGFMSVLPGASFLVKRFGGGGGGGSAPHQPVTGQPINGKLSQSTMTISHHNNQQGHFAHQRNHVLL